MIQENNIIKAVSDSADKISLCNASSSGNPGLFIRMLKRLTNLVIIREQLTGKNYTDRAKYN